MQLHVHILRALKFENLKNLEHIFRNRMQKILYFRGQTIFPNRKKSLNHNLKIRIFGANRNLYSGRHKDCIKNF